VPLSKRSRELNRALPIDVPHLAERYGIFTIIVLGESFVKVISGVGGTLLDTNTILVGILVLTVTASLWWLYFDDVAGALVKPSGFAAYAWIYSHLPIAIGLTAFGVGAKKALLAHAGEPLHAEYRWLIALALILYLLFVALLDEVTVREDQGMANRTRGAVRLVGALVVFGLALLGTSFSAVLFMGLVAIVFVLEVATEVATARRR